LQPTAHPDKQFVVATTKREVIAALDQIRNTVEANGGLCAIPGHRFVTDYTDWAQPMPAGYHPSQLVIQ
jgi:hypothetical protein